MQNISAAEYASMRITDLESRVVDHGNVTVRVAALEQRIAELEELVDTFYKRVFRVED